MASLVARASRQLRGNEDAENPSRAAKPAEERKRAAFSDLTNVGAASSKDLGGKPAKTSAGKKVEKEEIPSRPGSSSGSAIAAVMPDPKNLAAPVANPPFAPAAAPAAAPFSVVASTNVSLWAAQMPAVDRPDAGNTQAVAEYAADIYKYLRERETVLRLKDDYMQSQQDVTEKMRMILVDWLVEVHWKFKLSPDTLFLTIHLLDRYLSHVNVKRTKLQLVGVTCMLLASKHEEIYPPEIKDFVHVTDKAYTKQEILNMEVSALNTLGFQLTSPSPLAFLQRMTKVQECTPEHISLCQYLLELTLCHYRSIRHLPSHLAAAALFLANKIMKISPAWSQKLQDETGYQESQIKSCAKEMCALLQAAEKASLQAVRKKFSQSAFHRVAKMVA